MRDEVNQLEKLYVGEMCRIEIPLQSVITLRRVAEELRGLAYILDSISRTRVPPSEGMLQVKMAVRRTNKRMTAIRARGRPKRSRNYF